jgi:hypothetical protein
MKTKKNRRLSVAGARKATFTAVDNVKETLATKAAWRDHLEALLGGFSYVMLPTLIERLFRVDLTGPRGYATTITVNLLLGAIFRSPGYVAGTLGAAATHFMYARTQDTIIRPALGKYLWRFDPTVTTSSMSDGSTTNTAPVGTTIRTVAGERIATFPPSPSPATLATLAPQPPAMPTVAPAAVADNYATVLRDNYASDLRDNYATDLRDNYGSALRDNYATSLTGLAPSF